MCALPAPPASSARCRELAIVRDQFSSTERFCLLVHLCSKGSFPVAMPVGCLAEFFSIYKNAKCLKWESNDNIIRILSWGWMRHSATVGGGCAWVLQFLRSKFVSYLFPFRESSTHVKYQMGHKACWK
uniref:Uncharacterized protein n=1 Tax=Pipistrellus kuhlii TaxID=59472 RepID=A0A7J7VN41_PIPKU|nr:hypothetical protein mPipKuh1_008433 [Pipistrellus kuhlii]